MFVYNIHLFQMYGIDLGTSNSCVATLKNQDIQMVKNSINQLITPSFLAYTPKGLLYGMEAKNQLMINPGNTIYSTKRLIGRNFDDFEVQNQKSLATYNITDQNNSPMIQTPLSPLLSPTQVSSLFLQHLTKNLSSKDVVITVPAYFNNSQKEQTAQAASLANLNLVRLIAEPTAAALAYNAKNPSKSDEILLVIDLGAGTFDVSVVEKSSDVYSVISSAGDNFFGGDDYTNLIFAELQNSKTLSPSQQAELLQISELAKHTLSKQQNFTHPLGTLSRAKYEQICAPLDQRLSQPILQAISDANIRNSQISKILLVGGQTRQPSVQKFVQTLLGKKPLDLLDPDLCVAQGAALQGGIINKTVTSVLLVDVAPLSLGIETIGGNAPIPIKQTQVFTTTVDYQESVVLNVYQGERQLASQNHFLGVFSLPLKKAKKGVPRVEISFEVDQNGLVKVSAKDLETGEKQEIEIKQKGGEQEVSAEDKKRDSDEIERRKLILEVKELGGEELVGEGLNELKKRVQRLKRRVKVGKK